MMKHHMYLHGFASTPLGSKAQYFKEKIEKLGKEMHIPDLNKPSFEKITITAQIEEVNRVINDIDEPVNIIGSSMGALVAVLFADKYPEFVNKLLLIAPAFDFASPRDNYFNKEIRETWKQKGFMQLPHFGYNTIHNVHFGLIEDAGKYSPHSVNISCPVLIVHGLKDEIVNPDGSKNFAENRNNVQLELLDTDHQMLGSVDKLWELTSKFFELT